MVWTLLKPIIKSLNVASNIVELQPSSLAQPFVLMLVLIPWKEKVTSENTNVYLALLIEELQELWHGVNDVNVSTDCESKHFVLKAILMWCIHDYPVYGIVSGQVTKNYTGCTECGPNVSTRQSTALGKNLYLGHRRYLPRNHPYQRLQRACHGKDENKTLPCPLIGRDIVRHANARDKWLNASNRSRHGGVNDPVHQTGVKRLSSLFFLPYWQVSVP